MKSRIFHKSYFAFLIFIFLFIFGNNVFAVEEKLAAPPKLKLQVPIFGYTEATNLAEYIKTIYQYALYVLVPIAIVIVIWAGIIWIFAGGNVARIKEAKKYITGALTGVIIGLLSYVILSFVGITELKNPNIEYIAGLECCVLADNNSFLMTKEECTGAGGTIKEFSKCLGEGEESDTSEPLNSNIDVNFKGLIFCPHSGGAAALEPIARSTLGKVTYRWGATGGKPPYTIQSQKIAGSHYEERKQKITYCPAGTICLDCSGYTNYLLKCAGLKSYGGGTASIFGSRCSNSELITSFTNTSINNIPLKPGDALGKPSQHVRIYIGNGILYESAGGSGWNDPGGKAAKKSQVSSHSFIGSCVKRYGT